MIFGVLGMSYNPNHDQLSKNIQEIFRKLTKRCIAKNG